MIGLLRLEDLAGSQCATAFFPGLIKKSRITINGFYNVMIQNLFGDRPKKNPPVLPFFEMSKPLRESNCPGKNLARIMHKFSTAATKSSALTALRDPQASAPGLPVADPNRMSGITSEPQSLEGVAKVD